MFYNFYVASPKKKTNDTVLFKLIFENRRLFNKMTEDLIAKLLLHGRYDLKQVFML